MRLLVSADEDFSAQLVADLAKRRADVRCVSTDHVMKVQRFAVFYNCFVFNSDMHTRMF